ncbi:tyrosine-type recombinase/integrase [Teichococcus wenyumeiae]|nr:tyrosine-type recombinase/integrase [Pseudoroseomonas wenyumeiae]
MKNFTKRAYEIGGTAVFQLIDDHGSLVTTFDHFARQMVRRGRAVATVKRYLEVVANFLDYLAEAGAFGQAVPSERLVAVVEDYFRVRQRASEIRAAKPGSQDPMVREYRAIAEALDLHSVDVNPNMVAAVNLFIALSELHAQTEAERAQALGPRTVLDASGPLLKVLTTTRGKASRERRGRKSGSKLANVIRPGALPTDRSQTVAFSVKKGVDADQRLDFPLAYLAPLFDAATSHRDRALWTLLAGGGLRTSEAMALVWEGVDVAKRTVHVFDPNGRRTPKPEQKQAFRRWKGRLFSETYIFEPLKTAFFDSLALYLRDEYVPGVDHDHVFQDIRQCAARGRPMADFSDTARDAAFKRAVRRAEVPPPEHGAWGLHSLRHTYGVYLTNYLPIDGGYGLDLREVQRLMGHSDPATTEIYARRDGLVLEAKLAFADTHVFGGGTDVSSLPSFVVRRLRAEANRLEAAAGVQ